MIVVHGIHQNQLVLIETSTVPNKKNVRLEREKSGMVKLLARDREHILAESFAFVVHLMNQPMMVWRVEGFHFHPRFLLSEKFCGVNIFFFLCCFFVWTKNYMVCYNIRLFFIQSHNQSK